MASVLELTDRIRTQFESAGEPYRGQLYVQQRPDGHLLLCDCIACVEVDNADIEKVTKEWLESAKCEIWS